MKIYLVCILIMICNFGCPVDELHVKRPVRDDKRLKEIQGILKSEREKGSSSAYHEYILRGPLSLDQGRGEVQANLKRFNPNTPMMPEDTGWADIEKQFKDGDEIYYFQSSDEDWAYMRGRAGYVLIRQNTYVTRFVARMN